MTEETGARGGGDPDPEIIRIAARISSAVERTIQGVMRAEDAAGTSYEATANGILNGLAGAIALRMAVAVAVGGPERPGDPAADAILHRMAGTMFGIVDAFVREERRRRAAGEATEDPAAPDAALQIRTFAALQATIKIAGDDAERQGLDRRAVTVALMHSLVNVVGSMAMRACLPPEKWQGREGETVTRICDQLDKALDHILAVEEGAARPAGIPPGFIPLILRFGRYPAGENSRAFTAVTKGLRTVWKRVLDDGGGPRRVSPDYYQGMLMGLINALASQAIFEAYRPEQIERMSEAERDGVGLRIIKRFLDAYGAAVAEERKDRGFPEDWPGAGARPGRA